VAGRHVLVAIHVANPDGTPVSDDHYTRAITALQPVIDSIVWGPASAASASPSAEPSPVALADALRSIGPSGKIVFNRTDDARSMNTPFMVDPDGSNEVQVADDLTSGIWSPDGTRLLLGQLVTDPSPVPGAETAWVRPAVINADGSGFVLLNAYPDRHMQLFPQAWTADGQRIYVYSGDEDVYPADVGVYTVRASDGGDLTRIAAPAFDFSPDGTHILMNTILPRADQPDLNTLYVVNSDGTGMIQLSPDDPNASVISSDFWGGIAQDWSPDSSHVAFCLISTDTNQLGLFIVKRDGTGRKQIVPGSIGASSVRFSPDGGLLAFTAEAGPDNQIWVVKPDGSGLKQLTNNADGYVSIDPVWSPDGGKLLFQRKYFAPGTAFSSHDPADVTLWTMNADGSDQHQLSPTALATDWVGRYEWWPAAAPGERQ
jgi:Tol biopolymer transport system component